MVIKQNCMNCLEFLIFNVNFCKLNYVHVERENVTQIVVYSKSHSFFITIEPEITSSVKAHIIMKIKKIVSSLK